MTDLLGIGEFEEAARASERYRLALGAGLHFVRTTRSTSSFPSMSLKMSPIASQGHRFGGPFHSTQSKKDRDI